MALKNPILTAIETIVKSVPRAIAGNNAVKQAKEIEGLINDILKKPRLTVDDIAELKKLQSNATKALDDANVPVRPGTDAKAVTDAIAKKIADAETTAKKLADARKATEDAKKLAADAAAAAKKAADAAKAADKAEDAAKAATAAKKAADAAKKAADAKKRANAAVKAEKVITKTETPAPIVSVVTKVTKPAIGVGKVVGAVGAAGVGADVIPQIIPEPTPEPTPEPEPTPVVGGGGFTDSQNAARLEAEAAETGGGGSGTGGGGTGGGTGNTPEVFGPTVDLPEVPGDGEGNAPAISTPTTPTPVEDPGAGFEKTWLILRAKLLAAGLPVLTVDKSVDYFRAIITEGRFSGDNEVSDVVDQYLYSKSYTSKSGTDITSPFYEKFGKFNDKLGVQKKPSELVKLVLGYERLVDKYSVSTKFKSDDSIAKYLGNDTSVAELDERMNTARLKALEADKAYSQTLRTLNYISEDSQLTDFFLDPEIGTMELENRRKTAAFATEAVRRADSGIKLDTATAKQLSARFTALGYSEAQQANLSGEKYSNIADQLQPTTALSGIYEKAGAADATTIQKELESEQFLGMASARRKKLAEQNIKSFSGASGISRYGLSTGSVGSVI